MGRIGNVLKRGLKLGLTGYCCLYVGLSSYVLSDFCFYNIKKIREETQNNLIIKKFQVNLENTVKDLTIVGDLHLYNDKESKFAKDFVDKFTYVAVEGDNGTGFPDLLVSWATPFAVPPFVFSTLGNGRYFTNTRMDSWAEKKEKTLFYLESGKDKFNKNASLAQRLLFIPGAFAGLAIAPMFYFEGKKELSSGKNQNENLQNKTKDSEGRGSKLADWMANLDKRDDIMAKNIIKILEKNEVDSLLVIIGKGHLPGVIKNLKEKI